MSAPVNVIYEFGSFRLEVAERRLVRAGEPVKLAPKEFDLLVLLVERAGHAIKKDDLLAQLWPDVMVEEGTLTRNVSRLRTALGETREGDKFIETLPKFGYRFLAEVTQRAVPTTPIVIANTLLPAARATVSETNFETPTLTVAANSFKRGWRLAALLLCSVMVAMYFAFRTPSPPSPPLVETPAKIIPLTSAAGRESAPSFSPDGRQIAYAWWPEDAPGADLYVKLVGAGEPLRLTDTPQDEFSPSWSPDGKSLAFMRLRGEASELFVMPALGGAERKIADLQSTWVSLTWTPDGQSLVVPESIAASEKEKLALVQINVADGARRVLTHPPPLAGDDDPRFAPDGKTLAFKRTTNRVNSRIFLANPDGSQARALNRLEAPIQGLTWLPDSQSLLCSAFREGSHTLWRVPVNGAEAVPLTNTGRRAKQPALAANGTLAFVEELQDANLWRLELDKPHRPLRKFLSSNQPDHSAEFSPDGTRLVFASARSGHDEIWVAQRDGSNPVQLTHFNGLATGSPHWSPDGKSIAFDARPQSSGDLFIIDAQGGAPRQLTTDASHDVIPTWSHDGRWLYFCSNRTGTLQLWKLPVAGGAAQQLTRQGGMEAQEAPAGKFVYYLKGRGIGGLWRVTMNGEHEEPVSELAEAGFWRYWTINASGLYFVAHNDQFPYQIKHFNFATAQLKTIATIDKQPLWLPSGLAVAPDGRTLLYAHDDLYSSSIRLLENFR